MNQLEKHLIDEIIKDFESVDKTIFLKGISESANVDAGEPETAFYVDGAKRIINGAKPENWFKQGGYIQMDKPKSDFMRGKGKGKDTESQFRKVTYKLKGVTEPVKGKSSVPYQVDKWKNVTPKNVKQKTPRYWDLTKVNENIFIPKEFIEEWVNTKFFDILNEITSNTSSPLGKDVDDGPNFFFANYDIFDKISIERAEHIGYTVFKQIMSGELEDYYEHPMYPNGPVKASTPFPAGLIGKLTASNQKDYEGDVAYDKWIKHVTRSMALAGYSLVADWDVKAKEISIKDADDILANVNDAGGINDRIEEDITIPINVGDTVLGGKFKNKKITVKDIGKNEKGDITINGKPLLKYRLIDESVDEVISEVISKELFDIIVRAISTFIAGGLMILAINILNILWNGIKAYTASVKDMINPGTFTQFTNELSKDKKFNKKFLELLSKHGSIKNNTKRADLNSFLDDVVELKEFNNILDKYYPWSKHGTNGDRYEAIREFKSGIKDTIAKKGNWIVKAIEKKFPEIIEPNTFSSRGPNDESILFEIPMDDLKQVDKFADKQLNPLDVVITDRHFLDRLVDPRNKKPISFAELIGFFKRLAQHKDQFIDFLKKYGEIVAKDNRTKINIPFMRQANKAIAKTIMRKDDFKTPSPELKFEDNISGGLSSSMSLEDIAKKHSVDIELIKSELKKGIKVEKEHTTDINIAKEIAMDHLVEDPRYYTKLADIEKSSNENLMIGYPDQKWIDNHNKKLKKIRAKIDSEKVDEYTMMSYSHIQKSAPFKGLDDELNELTKGEIFGGKLKIGGESVPVEVELLGADNKKKVFITKIIGVDKKWWSKLPKDGILEIPARIFRTPGGGWYKVKTPKVFEKIEENIRKKFKLLKESGSLPGVIPIPASKADDIIKHFIKTIVNPSNSVKADTITGLGSTRSILKKLPGAKSVAGDLDLLAVANSDRKTAIANLTARAKSLGLDYQIAFGNVFSVGYPYEDNKYQVDLMVAEDSPNNDVYNYMVKFRYWSDEAAEQNTSFILKGAHRSELTRSIVKAVGLSAGEGGFNEFIWNNKYNSVEEIVNELNKKASKFRDPIKKEQTIEVASLIGNKLKDVGRLKSILADSDGFIINRYPHSLFKKLPLGYDVLTDMVFSKVEGRGNWESLLDKKFNISNTIERMRKFDDVIELIKDLLRKKALTPNSVVYAFKEMKKNFDTGKAGMRWNEDLERYIEKDFPFLKNRW